MLCCSLGEQQNEATTIIGAVFIEASKDNNRTNLVSEKVAVARRGYFFLNLESLVVAGDERGSLRRR